MADTNESLYETLKNCLESSNKWKNEVNVALAHVAEILDVVVDRINLMGNQRIETNADRVRHMTDEELLETIYQHMGNAAACPDCFRKNGKERLQMWLEMENKED